MMHLPWLVILHTRPFALALITMGVPVVACSTAWPVVLSPSAKLSVSQFVYLSFGRLTMSRMKRFRSLRDVVQTLRGQSPIFSRTHLPNLALVTQRAGLSCAPCDPAGDDAFERRAASSVGYPREWTAAASQSF